MRLNRKPELAFSLASFSPDLEFSGASSVVVEGLDGVAVLDVADDLLPFVLEKILRIPDEVGLETLEDPVSLAFDFALLASTASTMAIAFAAEGMGDCWDGVEERALPSLECVVDPSFRDPVELARACDWSSMLTITHPWLLLSLPPFDTTVLSSS